MKRTMLTVDGSGHFAVQKYDVPELKEYEVLVEVKASGISPGTELGGIKHMRQNPADSAQVRPFGYQNSGIIIKKGSKVTGLEKGMRVACMGGGARHTDIAAVPQNLCVPIPENVSFEEAAFANLAGTAVQAVRRGELLFGENVLVAGLGILGNLIGQLSSASGTHTAGLDFIAKRRTIAQKTGFEVLINPEKEDWIKECQDFTSDFGIDCTFICFGGDATLFFKQLLKVMKITPDGHTMGRVVIPGGCEIKTRFGAAVGNMDIRGSARTGPGYHDDLYEQGRDYPKVFVPWTTNRNIVEFYRALSRGTISMKKLITHTFDLKKGAEACNLLVDSPDKALAIVLKP